MPVTQSQSAAARQAAYRARRKQQDAHRLNLWLPADAGAALTRLTQQQGRTQAEVLTALLLAAADALEPVEVEQLEPAEPVAEVEQLEPAEPVAEVEQLEPAEPVAEHTVPSLLQRVRAAGTPLASALPPGTATLSLREVGRLLDGTPAAAVKQLIADGHLVAVRDRRGALRVLEASLYEHLHATVTQ
jgi:hypothetical protein